MRQLSSRCTGHFGFSRLLRAAVCRRETREHSGHYLQALLVQSGERRNAENLSETVPGSARGMQRFLTDSPWDDEVIIGRLQEYLGTRWSIRKGCGCWTAATFPSRGGSRWEWPGSTAGGWEGGQLPGGDVPGLCQPVGTGIGGQGAVSARELDLGQRPV